MTDFIIGFLQNTGYGELIASITVAGLGFAAFLRGLGEALIFIGNRGALKNQDDDWADTTGVRLRDFAIAVGGFLTRLGIGNKAKK